LPIFFYTLNSINIKSFYSNNVVSVLGWSTKFRFAKFREIPGHFREISFRKVEVS
jgi:hypothetical protein